LLATRKTEKDCNMKLLIIGIDGGDIDIINAMDMPFLQSMIRERAQVPINLDLWSRGWSEVLTGLHGRETGAFYEKPKLDGTTGFTQKYNMDDYYRVPGCLPLWDQLAKRNLKSGFMNVPTTLPAPKVDGFFVSGAGSGFSPASRVPEAACYPQEISYELLKRNFIWEQRYWVSGIRDIDFFIERCTEAIIKRAQAFEFLSRQYQVDVGFCMHREFSTLTNLFMNKIQQLMKRSKLLDSTQKRIMSFFRVLDDVLKVTVTELAPAHVMIVSDHSARPYLFSLNLNHFLSQQGHLTFIRKKTDKKQKIKSEISRIKTKIARRVLKSAGLLDPRFLNPFNEEWPDMGLINYGNAYAFANRYVPGIYLNDERFLSVVIEQEKPLIIKRIVEQFNQTAEAKQYGLAARPYRARFKTAAAEKFLPDIWIDMPDIIFPEQKGVFVQPNPYWQSFDSLAFAKKDIMSGLKGRNALCVVEHEFSGDLTQGDLTRAYHLILKHFD